MTRANAIYVEPSIFSSTGSMPPHVFERSSNVSNNNWLYSGRVISNKTGSPQFLLDCEIIQIAVRNQDIDTFEVSIYEHDGNNINSTLLVTVSVVASRSEDFTISDFGTINPTKGKQLAARLTSGSAKNLKVFVLTRGTFDV